MTPTLLPVVMGLVINMDRRHFGIMLIFNLSVLLCTPPEGSAFFVGCAIGKTPIGWTAVKVLPIFAVMVVVLLLAAFISVHSMGMPNWIHGKQARLSS